MSFGRGKQNKRNATDKDRCKDMPTVGRHPLMFSTLQESWSKGSHAARELETVFL